MATLSEVTEFERLLGTLEGLTRAEIADMMVSRLPRKDAHGFIRLATGLSIDALRFVSARMLLRMAPRAEAKR